MRNKYKAGLKYLLSNSKFQSQWCNFCIILMEKDVNLTSYL